MGIFANKTEQTITLSVAGGILFAIVGTLGLEYLESRAPTLEELCRARCVPNVPLLVDEVCYCKSLDGEFILPTTLP